MRFNYEQELLDKLNSQFHALANMTMFSAGPEIVERESVLSVSFPVPAASKEDFNIVMTPEKFLKVSYKPKVNNKFVLPFSTSYDFREYDENTVNVSLENGVLKISAARENKKKTSAARRYEVV